jgi:hypothetical protein
MLPKTEGDGYMISAFQSRLFGWGRPLTPAEFASVNQYRRGQHYCDMNAAMEVLKSTEKKDLDETPFARYLLIGMTNEGYWNSSRMAIQVEDVIDCLKVLHPDFDFVLLLDHSQGHDKKREGSLDARRMTKGFGGAQPRLRDSTIEQEEGYLGPHEKTLAVGSIQQFQFPATPPNPLTDSGPLYLSPVERIAKQYERGTGKRRRVAKTKEQLKTDLEALGVVLPRGPHHTKKELLEFATAKAIAHDTERELTDPGWVGNTKGLLQCLMERGILDRDRLHQYTLGGPKDLVTGVPDPSRSLHNLMAECTDFKNEKSSLEFMSESLGVRVDFAPKFHAEMAGEGIEYSWGYSKGLYRRMPLKEKKGRVKFVRLVKKCVDPFDELTKTRVRKFSARARAYICTYFQLAQQKQAQQREEDILRADSANFNLNAAQEAPGDPRESQQVLFKEIERLMKAFKTHRCALDFDRGFINGFLKEQQL